MRLSLLLVFALAALAAAADAKKCSGKCVAVGACAGTETKGSCEDSQVCCVTGNDVGVKRKCKPTRKCSKLKGECRNRKCLPGEVKFKNKGKRVYCKGKKKCVCCSRSCENKSLCNLKGGYCQPTSLPCDGDLMTGKAFCKANKKLKGKKKNKCGCCVPKGTRSQLLPRAGNAFNGCQFCATR